MPNDLDIKPLLVCIGGLPGSGKSTVAEALRPGLPGDCAIVCPDRTRLAILGKPEGARLESSDITPESTVLTRASMLEQTRRHLLAGRTVLVPSAFTGAAMRAQFEALAAELDVPFRGFWMEAPVETLIARAETRQATSAGLNGQFNPSAVGREFINTGLIEGEVTWQRIDAARPVEMIANELIARLSLSAPAARLTIQPIQPGI